ncbi:SusD/RagB family nutrient-binding outer membrane lipoprotein [Flavobacterium sp.]|uniref:SusD/RagB family nutrient-binding outer membrane lipoprotein n=1 Tax=Flavobacterium sp. TaxID=239 RepID=UPI00261CAFA3|nr:SusD/RagB family nutrient-binding outer membrane lipoprotein [Flavobacterium sp.]MDD3003551.1 SusD/RagB family nutrient-binding outer membrane lipoprotein [Flavobacterium sp.]
MKLLQKIRNNKSSIVLLGLTMTFLSCSDFIDVDKDTDNPTTAPLSLLLTNIEVGVNDVTDYQFFTGTILSVYTHQMTTREEYDQYGMRVNNISLLNEWNNIYLTLRNIETLIKQANESGDMVYVGIAQMHKAYLLSVAVDLWGDVPFSEATKLELGITSPKFDDQKEIYSAVLDLIDEAKANIGSDEGLQRPSNDDLFYGGNISKWIRFANTFKLKLYNQTRLAPEFDQAGFDALVAEDNFFQSIADDFQFVQTDNLSPTDERNKMFLESYNSTQFGSYVSPWFYEIMKGVNPNIHNANPDPRMPYYFFNQLADGQFPPDQGDTTTGNPKADYWDEATGFFSIRFGTVGPNRDFSTENSVTYPGIFPAGGRYDDNAGGNINAMMAGATGAPTRPTGIAPHRILTYDEFLYIQAELIHVGKMAGNAATKLQEAMTASFAKVDEVVTLNKAPQTIPSLASNPASNTFINNVITEFNAGSDAKKLEIIMTQKWVATYGDPLDQYNDYRRTGYPVLANPLGSSPEYQLNNNDGFPLNDAETTVSGGADAYQKSFFWPQDELNTNKNAPVQKDATTYKIFWDN